MPLVTGGDGAGHPSPFHVGQARSHPPCAAATAPAHSPPLAPLRPVRLAPAPPQLVSLDPPHASPCPPGILFEPPPYFILFFNVDILMKLLSFMCVLY